MKGDKSVVMAGWAPSTVTNKSIFRIPVPAKIICYVPAKSVSKNKSISECAGARSQTDREALLSN